MACDPRDNKQFVIILNRRSKPFSSYKDAVRQVALDALSQCLYLSTQYVCCSENLTGNYLECWVISHVFFFSASSAAMALAIKQYQSLTQESSCLDNSLFLAQPLSTEFRSYCPEATVGELRLSMPQALAYLLIENTHCWPVWYLERQPTSSEKLLDLLKLGHYWEQRGNKIKVLKSRLSTKENLIL